MDYERFIEESVQGKRSLDSLARQVFLLGPASTFKGWEAQSFELIQEIADFFSVGVRSVGFCGSGHLGFSPVKLRPFVEGKSDLDVAIVDSECFRRYHEIVLIETRQFALRHKFPTIYDSRDGSTTSAFPSYRSYAARGMIRPDLMPDCGQKIAWMDFFRGLSRRHRPRYGKISAAVYLSEVAFTLKQSEVLGKFAEQKGYL